MLEQLLPLVVELETMLAKGVPELEMAPADRIQASYLTDGNAGLVLLAHMLDADLRA